MLEKPIFPMKYMRITLGSNKGAHKGAYAIDNAGKDTGIDNVFAPFTGVIKKIYDVGHTVWLESLNQLQYADGTIDYATLLLTHDNDVSNLYIGKVIKQGEIFYQEGTSGNTTGNHVHIRVGKGKFTGTGWYKNSYGNWCTNNQVEPYKVFFINKDTIILNDGGYKWKMLPATVYQGNSIVDYLKSIGEDSTYAHRKVLATKYGIKNYTGTASQNIQLLKILRGY